jgi:uncharacterized protein
MSPLKAQMQEDLKAAMKAHDQHLVITLRSVLAAVKQIEVDSRVEVGDDEVVKVLMQEVKKRRDALKYAEQQKREELIAQNKAELVMLQKYLGQPLSREELEKIIAEAIAGGADNIGKVMGVLNQNYKGKV